MIGLVGWLRAGGARVLLVTALIGAATLAPLVLFGSVVRQTIDRDVVARSAQERLITARIAAASVDRELMSVGDELMLSASRTTVHEGLRTGDRRSLDRRLRELLALKAGRLGAFLDPRGIVLAAPLAPELVGQDFSRRDYFSGAMSSDMPFVSEIFASASAGNPSVVGVSLAIREDGVPLGVLVLTLAPADMLSLLRPLDQVQGRELLIVDRANRVVAATDAGFQPLAAVPLPAREATASNEPVDLGGRPRVLTMADIDRGRWVLYVIDDPSVVLAGKRALLDQMREAGLAVGWIALVAAGLVVFLYAKTARQRDELQAGRRALDETNRALADANRHKSDFLASMSHELRTPLNAILGFSALLEEQLGGALTDRQRRYLANIGEAGRHLLALINDVLDLSKVEAGRLELRPELISLEAVLAPVLASTRAAAEAAGPRFEVSAVDDRLLEVDAGRMRQILYNLLSNAVKFTPAGGRVELRASVEGDALLLVVADTGIGIPADRRDRVFGTFERLHEGRSDATGTGLGLALTKRLVELHGGSIDFSARADRGTVFRVRIPNAVAAGALGERLLVVEDERRDADLVAALAGRVGLETEVVRSVDAATAAIRRSAPAAVVLDLRLPGERGERVLEVLKADPATRGIPVVVVTVEDDEGRSRHLGADDHITKPIEHDRLMGWLQSVASRRTRKEGSVAGAGR